ncbi:MAG: 50S ribosomal protein L13 [Chloroflexota bacterium]
MNTRTYSPKASEIERRWWLVDAEGQTLGRLASVLATKLRGKDKPIYAPHMDCGDFVVVINASRVNVTGRKLEQKKYYRHSGYPGGLTTSSLSDVMEKHPDRVIEKAVRGMLPKTALGDHMIKKLKVYAGAEHPHTSQQPAPWAITEELTGTSAT